MGEVACPRKRQRITVLSGLDRDWGKYGAELDSDRKARAVVKIEAVCIRQLRVRRQGLSLGIDCDVPRWAAVGSTLAVAIVFSP